MYEGRRRCSAGPDWTLVPENAAPTAGSTPFLTASTALIAETFSGRSLIKGEHIPVWQCMSRLEKGKSDVKCLSRILYEKDLQVAVVTAINQRIATKDEFLPGMKLAMERAFS